MHRNAVTGLGVLIAVVMVAGFVSLTVLERDRVVLYGDSIAAQSSREIRREQFPRLRIRAVSGATSTEMLVAARTEGGRPEVVVVELGTNDIDRGASVDVVIDNLLAFGQVFPQASCVVYVNLYEGAQMLGGAHVAEIRDVNRRLDQLRRTHDRLRVVDWNAVVHRARRAGQHVLVDTVHPNHLGKRLLADAIGAALETC